MGWVYGRTQRRLERFLLERRYQLPPEAARDIHLRELGLASPDRSRYAPSPWGVLGRVLPAAEIEPGDVFLDYGCGLGRVLLEAALQPYERVVGVEVAPQFVAAARQLLELNRPRLICQHVEVIEADAMDYFPPDDVTVAYFANPFGGAILKTAIERLVESARQRPRRVRVIQLAPPEATPLDDFPGVELVRFGRRALRRWSSAEYLRLYEIRTR